MLHQYSPWGRGTEPVETGVGQKDMGCNPENPAGGPDPVLLSTSGQQSGPTKPDTGTLASASAIEFRALTSPMLAITMAQIQEAMAINDDNGDTDEQKACLDAYQSIIWGLHVASHTLLEGYQRACLEVQGMVNQSVNLSTANDIFSSN